MLLLGAVAGLLLLDAVAALDDKRRVRGWLVLALLALLLVAHGLGAWVLRSAMPVLGALGWSLVVAVLGCSRLWPELCALKENGYGLCSGKAQPPADGQPPDDKALIEWLHEGIQRSAGRDRHDPPLTFADLWSAPRAAEPPLDRGFRGESISLQMFSTNVTLGRPVTWPLLDRTARLFFRADEWERIFPPTLLAAVVTASAPYAPASDSDPPAGAVTAAFRAVAAGDAHHGSGPHE